MSNKIVFGTGGGANSIGGSFYVLKLGETILGIDCGAKLRCNIEDAAPDFSVVPRLDYLFISHAHRDHVERVPQAVKRFPELKEIFATHETKLLSLGQWKQTVRRFLEMKLPLPFTMEDARATYRMIQNINMEKPIILPGGITVYPISAEHILGSLSFLIEYRGAWCFITNDICYEKRSFFKGALKFSPSEPLRLLIRESTCINEVKDREAAENGLVSATRKAVRNGEQVLISTLSIDRCPDTYAVLKNAGLDPLIDGSRKTFDIYRQYFKGSVLDEARTINSYSERINILRRGKPAVIIAPSGMLSPNTPSSWWAERFLGDEHKHIFVVCYQDPTTQGFKLMKSERNQFLSFNNGYPIKRKCDVRYFDLSAHMDKKDGEELEDRMNPDTTIYVHGEDAEIEKYISEHQNDGCRRVKALVGQEVEA